MRSSNTARLAIASSTAIVSLMMLSGCELDSFIDPSRTGRFEYEPTTIPVLERIDVIEPHMDYWSHATPPTPEDLLPLDLEYRIYPGDVLAVRVFELQTQQMWTERLGRVDAAGNLRIPEVGDVRAAGLTAQQFEDELRRRLRQMIQNPQVDVAVEQGGALRYTVYGYVANTGQYMLTDPNLRLLEALANAGGIPLTTERVYVIRQVILTPEAQPTFERDEMQPQPDGQRPPQGDQPSIDELIEQLEDQPAPSPQSPQPPAQSQPQQPQSQPSSPQPPPSDADDPSAAGAAGTEPQGAAMAEPEQAEAGIASALADLLDQEQQQETPQPPSPPVDVDELEPVRTPQQPPVDVDVVTPPPQPDDQTGDSFIYIPERGEWVRVPGAAPETAPPSPELPTHVDPAHALVRIIEIDYQELLRGGMAQNVVIRPNDLIYVEGPMQGLFYIDGEIGRVGVYELPSLGGPVTLSRAVTAAGGLGPIATPHRVDLTRKVGKNLEATIRLNLAAIRQRTEPDVIIKPNDHIIIGTTFWATPLAIIRNGFRVTYGFGFLLDRNFGSDVFGVPPEALAR